METSGTVQQASRNLPRSVPLGDLCAAAGIPCPAGAEEVPIGGVTAASARVRPGWLFAALPGSRTDGRQYIPDALRAGAAAVLYPAERDGGQPAGNLFPAGAAVGVPLPPGAPARAVFARLVSAWYGDPGRRLRLVGVTGTNGKTTVTAMLCHILRTAGVACGCIGTLGYRLPAADGGAGSDRAEPFRPADECAAMTTPDPEELYAILARMADSAPVGMRPTVVMEVSSHALAQGRVEPLTFDLAVFTNLTPEHLDYHGGMEDYFAAKETLFRQARVGVLNGDDAYARSLPLRGLPVGIWYVCRTGGQAADGTPDILSDTARCIPCRAERIRPRRTDGTAGAPGGVEFRFSTPDLRMHLSCPLPGEFTVSNASVAAAAALASGVAPRQIREALDGFPGVPGRLERVPTGGAPFSVFIDYAHTPDALERLLLTFHGLCREPGGARRRPGRIILLFGCGGDRDRGKRRLMARIASRLADAVVITSDNSRSEDPAAIIRDILGGIDRESEYAVIPDRAEAIRHTVRTARAGDIILLCGKGHETYEIDRTGRHPFDERAIVRDALRTRGEP